MKRLREEFCFQNGVIPLSGLSQAIDPMHLSAFADEGSAVFVLRKEVSPGEPYPHVSSRNRKLRAKSQCGGTRPSCGPLTLPVDWSTGFGEGT